MIIKLLWKYIKYEVDQETWKGAKVRITGDANADVLNEAQTGVDAFDRNYCYRKIEQGLMNLQDVLHKFFVGFTSSYERPLAVGDRVSFEYQEETTYGYITSIYEDTITGATMCTIRIEGEQGDIHTPFDLDDVTRADEEDGNNVLDNQSEYWMFELTFDDRRNIDAQLLASELHKYLVFNVLQEWAKMALPAMAEDYKKRTEEEKNRVKAICYRKECPELDD